ncbi:hypothetical protein GCM10009530_40080 [Microbispora corallina]|uniref:Mycothiol-dependent maleylpyruvate isomerase metal-binding domain-containing protein n=1 Tax=Microbispora corallina TaxID=83302 RepID=A0ABQ4G8S3_9ACTN|nr:hypothetical protein Mco01_64810 [Microbispora corallina]
MAGAAERKTFIEPLTIRRRALVDLVQNMPDSCWNMQSRCSEWSIHQVVRHVRDVARIHVARLGGVTFPFSTSGPSSAPRSDLLTSNVTRRT